MSQEFAVHEPATGKVIASVPDGGAGAVDAAVRAAHRGFESWSRRAPQERGRALAAAAAVLRAHAGELAALESREVGKPVTQARAFDLPAAISIFEYFAGLSTELPGAARESGSTLDVTTLRPFGVVGGIVPFNWPPIHAAGKSAPALAVGNAVVLKPAEQAPLTVLRIAELIREVLPDDVLHVVTGSGATGRALAAHPLVRKLSFTGAPTTGAAVLKTAADNLTPTVMELGGKNPLIVFGDADLDAAAHAAIEGGFFNQGEACTAASRILVQDKVHDEFAVRLVGAVARLRVGDGADERTHVGPLVTRAHQQRVLDYLRMAIEEGATVAAAAPLPDDPALADGFYVAPTLLTGVRPDMRIAREEIFGPVVTVLPFQDEHDAVRIANGTDFGLVAAVYTRDQERALRIAREVEAGIVYVNNYHRAGIGIPFGGTKHSGFGREHAWDTLREYGYSKTLRLVSGPEPVPAWPVAAEVLGSPILGEAASGGA